MREFTIRPLTADDLDAVNAIYNHYVETSTATFQLDPETAEERRDWFHARTAMHPTSAAEAGGELIGYAALSPWKSRCAYRFSAELSVYIRPDWHRRGVGRALVLDLLERGRAAGLHAVIGGACTEHPASIALQESLGFTHVAHFREVGYKFGRWLDVVYLQLVFPEPHP